MLKTPSPSPSPTPTPIITTNTNQKTLLYIVFIVLILVIGFSIYKSHNNTSSDITTNQALVTNFEECANAGYPVMESYPRQCRTTNGELFVENVVIPKPNIKPNPAPTAEVTIGYAVGHVTIGPNCPGPERVDQPCITPPEVYSSRMVIVYKSDGTTIKEKGKIDDKGNYRIVLQPGSYFLQIEPAGIGPGEKKLVVIKSGKTTITDFNIDTGIR